MFALWTLLKTGDEGVPADAAGADRYLKFAASSGFMEAMYHRGMELMREARRCALPFRTLDSWSGSRRWTAIVFLYEGPPGAGSGY